MIVSVQKMSKQSLWMREVKRINTLSTSGAVPYRYTLFRYSLDRYGTACVHTCSGTVWIHLSTSHYKLSYPNCIVSLLWDGPHMILGLGSAQIGTESAIFFQMWTGGAVPYRYKNHNMDRV